MRLHMLAGQDFLTKKGCRHQRSSHSSRSSPREQRGLTHLERGPHGHTHGPAASGSAGPINASVRVSRSSDVLMRKGQPESRGCCIAPTTMKDWYTSDRTHCVHVVDRFAFIWDFVSAVAPSIETGPSSFYCEYITSWSGLGRRSGPLVLVLVLAMSFFSHSHSRHRLNRGTPLALKEEKHGVATLPAKKSRVAGQCT